jgi:hypothetical protein
MVREWKPELGSREGEGHLIAVYNAFFRSNSFLHLGEYAAFLSAALLPYGEARSQAGDEAADSDRLFWRFHGPRSGHLPPDGELRYLVGGKAAGLLAMHAAGLPVPEGFALATRAGRQVPADPPGNAEGFLAPATWDGVLAELAALETSTGRRFGDPDNPLLLSVRSGAPVSMPGMMDTILNIGLGKAVLDARAADPAEAAFWFDCRLHLVWLYASSVHAG